MTPEQGHWLLVGICGVLMACCIVLPYTLGVPPRTGADRRWLVAIMTTLAVVLCGLVFLRSS